jgi:hypothetical protein
MGARGLVSLERVAPAAWTATEGCSACAIVRPIQRYDSVVVRTGELKALQYSSPLRFRQLQEAAGVPHFKVQLPAPLLARAVIALSGDWKRLLHRVSLSALDTRFYRMTAAGEELKPHESPQCVLPSASDGR